MKIIALNLLFTFLCPLFFVHSPIVLNKTSNEKKQSFCITKEIAANANYFQFQDDNLTQFNLPQHAVLLTANFNTQNLNMGNEFTFASIQGAITSYQSLVYNYHFSTSFQNSACSWQLLLQPINYDTLTNSSILLNQVFNCDNTIQTFANNFLNNSTCQIPTGFVNDCFGVHSNIVTSLINIDNLPYVNPNLGFLKYSTIALFKSLGFHAQINQWMQTPLNVVSNSLFKQISLISLNQNFLFQTKVQQLDRYLINFSQAYPGNYPQYGPDQNFDLNLSLQNITSNLYFFNPNLLFTLILPSYTKQNQPYTNFPNFTCFINSQVVNTLFNADLTALVVSDLLQTFVNNSLLRQEILTYWNKGWYSVNFLTSLFHLLGSNEIYNNQTNSFIWDVNIHEANNLYNLFQANSLNPIQPLWVQNWFSLTNLNQLPSINEAVNLYQALLRVYQNSQLHFVFQNNNAINARIWNCSWSLQTLTPFQIVQPYKYEYVLNTVQLLWNQTTINLNLTDLTKHICTDHELIFSILKFGNYQVVHPDTQIIKQYNQQNYLLLVKPNTLPELFLKELSLLIKLSPSLLAQQYAKWTSNSKLVLKTNLEKDFFLYLLYATLFEFCNLGTQILTYLQEHYFSNNIFVPNSQNFLQLVQYQTQNELIETQILLSSQYGFLKNNLLSNSSISNSYFNDYIINFAWSPIYSSVSSPSNNNKSKTNSHNQQSKKLEKTQSISKNHLQSAKWIWIYFVLSLLLLIVLICIIFISRHIFKKRKQIAKFKLENQPKKRK